MKRALLATAIICATHLAFAQSSPTKPAPKFTYLCAFQDKHQIKTGGITLIWDGDQFTEVPEFEKTKAWRIERSEMIVQGEPGYPTAHQLYFNALQTPEDIQQKRRYLLNVHSLGDMSLGLSSFFYSKAELRDGMLQSAVTRYFAGCSSELGKR